MPQLPRHGSVRRYKSGCRCNPCTEANTRQKARERDAKRAAEGKPPLRTRTRASVPTGSNKPTADPQFGPIETATRAAIEQLTKDTEPDLVARLRHEVMFGAARIMDNPSKPHLFKAQAEVIRATLLDLTGGRNPEDGDVDALRDWMEAIRGSRGRGNSPSLHDAEESG